MAKLPKITNWTPTNIKRFRKYLNYSQASLASALGVTQAVICIWESGKSKPRECNITALNKLYIKNS